jgi:hypothetical protein
MLIKKRNKTSNYTEISLIPDGMAINRKTNNTRWQGCGEEGASCTAGRM